MAINITYMKKAADKMDMIQKSLSFILYQEIIQHNVSEFVSKDRFWVSHLFESTCTQFYKKKQALYCTGRLPPPPA